MSSSNVEKGVSECYYCGEACPGICGKWVTGADRVPRWVCIDHAIEARGDDGSPAFLKTIG